MDTQSSWAAKYMKTHGWNEGEGIGKTLQGRTDPIKVKYKFDKNCIGHDQAHSHKFKWWERAFETAAQSIEVGNDNKLVKTGKGGPVVSTSLPVSKALNKAMLYGRFVKRGVMMAGKVVEVEDSSDSDSDSDTDTKSKIGQIVEISDADLFKRCGGLTGHKGARHGHSMSSKLERLKKTEEEGLKKLKEVQRKQEERKKRENLSNYEHIDEPDLILAVGPPKPKTPRAFEEPAIDGDVNGNTEEKPKKKKKKKRVKMEDDKPDELEVPPSKKEKKETTDFETESQSNEHVDNAMGKRKKKKKLNRTHDSIDNNDSVEESQEEKPKKKKKKKDKLTEVIEESEILKPIKKKKKKRKK